jgi:hypothetical protein
MKLASLLPFMDNEELKTLAFDVIKGEKKGIKLMIIFPFLKKHDLKEITDLLIAENKGKELYGALPFLSKDDIKKLYEAVKEGKLTDFKEEALLPFLDKDTLKEMFDDLVAKSAETSTE